MSSHAALRPRPEPRLLLGGGGVGDGACGEPRQGAPMPGARLLEVLRSLRESETAAVVSTASGRVGSVEGTAVPMHDAVIAFAAADLRELARPRPSVGARAQAAKVALDCRTMPPALPGVALRVLGPPRRTPPERSAHLVAPACAAAAHRVANPEGVETWA
jgi:hypothetical protein